MKDWIPFLCASAIAVALLAFWVGAVSVTGANSTAPHGIIEYWFYRYQTIIAAFIALSGALIVMWQIRETRQQHRSNVRLALRNEFDALQSAERFAEMIIRSSDDKRMDVPSALMKVAPTRYFNPIDTGRLERIEQWSGDVVNAFFKIMRDAIVEYEDWREAGSVVTQNIFGTTSPSFTDRIEKIREAAVHVVEVTKYRRNELEALAA